MKPPGAGLLGDFGATLVGRYGTKAFDFLILAAVSRLVDLELVGGVFLAEAAGRLAYRFVDLGLYPVLMRAAARERLGARTHSLALIARGALAVALSLGYAALTPWTMPEHPEIAVAFFALAGLRTVHEVPRAAIAGSGGFTTLAKIGLGSKAVELAITAAATFGGLGIWGWALGRLLSHVALLATAHHLARARIPKETRGSLGALVHEGLPFWAATLLLSGSAQLDMLILGATGGLTDTAELGVATKVVGATLTFVGALTFAAFPRLARERGRHVSRTQVLAVGGVALGLGAVVVLGAPLISWALVGEVRPQLTTTLRMMSPVIVVSAVARPLQVWLQAKDKELSLVALAFLVGATSAVGFALLVPRYGAEGAAWARVLRSVVELGGAGFLVLVASRAPRSPLAWLLARVVGPDRLRRRMARELDATVRELASAPGVIAVEVQGSARNEAGFEPGASDVDLLVVTDAPDVPARVPPSRLFPRHLTRVDAPLLRRARELGHPLLDPRLSDVRAGERIAPEANAEHTRAARRSNAIGLLLRLQRELLDEGRLDGGARARPIAKTVAVLWRTLERDDAPAVRTRGWLDGPQTSAILVRALEAVAAELADATDGWDEAHEAERSLPTWLDPAPLNKRVLASAPHVDGLELTPTGPTRDDPMLIGVLRAPDAERVEAWLRTQAAAGPLRAPFRSHRWPVLLPWEVVRADAYMEHAPLLHRARAACGNTLTGEVPAGLVPPATFTKAAALRSIVHALVRRGDDRPSSGARLRALADARLPALAQELAGEASPADPDEVPGRAEHVGTLDVAALRDWVAEWARSIRGALDPRDPKG